MKIAVITPSKPNRGLLLEECRASVREQTRPAELHAIEVDHKGAGPAQIRNKLVRELPMEYDWVAFVDDDDLLLPTHLEKLSAVSDSADVVYSPCQHNYTHAFNLESLKIQNYISVTCLVRREVFEKVGGFDNVAMEDWELWKKIANADGRFVFVPETTWTYRLQSDSRDLVEYLKKK
jgi:cellulose synthase/poly-beta-1,6-N-acetylglucosamine synthase-like glycosyltransferase